MASGQLPAAPKGAKWAKAPRVIESVSYRSDGGGFNEPGHQQLFILSAQGGTPQQLSKGEFDVNGPLSWSPDGSKLLFSSNRLAEPDLNPNQSDLFELSVDGGALKQLTDRNGPDDSGHYSPDGKSIAYIGFDDKRLGYQSYHLYLMNADGTDKRVLIDELDLSVQSPTWTADGKGIYFGFDFRGETRLGLASLDGKHELLADHIGGLSMGRPYTGGSFSVSNTGAFAFTLSGSDHPADLAVGQRGSDSVKRLTRLNDDLFAFKQPGKVEEIKWKSSFDGREIQGWIVKPPHFDPEQKYPLVLEIHGGPFAAYGPHFSIECQLYASAGYVVLYSNPRGSTSYGHEFANLIHHNYPSQDYDDLISGVDAVIEQGYVAKDELYVTGGSGGGVLTAWIVGKTNRFRAAVVAKPVINWASFVLTADAYPYFTQYWFKSMPWENPMEYWERSPLSLVGNVETPTMLLTGEQDHRTPISESEQFYQALKLRKVDAAMVRIPEASHGIASRPSQLVAKVAYILAWFERYAPKSPE
jgi:dipeptidyl aminopeptidase/acylaminoacyl peptidase